MIHIPVLCPGAKKNDQMKQSDIKIGQTYMFVATDHPQKKHLEGQPFTVTEIKPSRQARNKHRKVNIYFDADGNTARAEELEPID